MYLTRFIIVMISVLFGQYCLAQQPLENASEAYAISDYTSATRILDKIIDSSATAEAYMLRADCYHKQGMFSEALEDYNKAALYGYRQDDLYLNRGICKSSLQMYEESRHDLIHYMNRHEDDPKPYYWMGVIEYMTLQNKDAIRYLDEAIRLDSNYVAAYYLRGAAFVEQGKSMLAHDDFEKAFQLDPKLHRAKFHLALVYIDMNQFEKSHEMLGELLLENTDYVSEILYYRGVARYELRDYEGACNDWMEASDMGDKEAEYNYKSACLKSKGKPRIKKRHHVEF